MADREGTRKTAEAIVVSTTPDVCNTPAGSAMVPVPYPIIGRFDAVTGEVPTVLFTKQEAFTTASRITTVQGDEAGSGGGVSSGVNTGYCRPATYSSTVFAQGHQVVSHECKMEMNCAGTDGPGNTQGQVIYLQVEMTVKLDETGEVVGETNPEVAPETPEEQSLWQKASPWVHGILDFGGLVPVFGEALDGVNALIYLGEGDKLNAGLSAAGMIPIAGWGATATKVGIKAEKLIVKEVIEEGAEKLTKEVIEEGAEKATKEVVEEGAEKVAKQGTEDGVKVTRKEGKNQPDKADNWCKKRGLYPGSSACLRRQETMRNIEKDIKKRTGEFHEDPKGLPWDIPGAPARDTRKGHLRIINELKRILAEHNGVVLACCGGA